MNNDTAVRNKVFMQQAINFDGLRFGKIMPTDLDAYIDFGNRFFVFIEAKYGNAKMPLGQRLAIERLCDAVHRPDENRYALALICKHSTSSGDVDLSKCVVTQFRWFGEWRLPKESGKTVKQAIDYFNPYVGEIIRKKEKMTNG